VVVKAGEDLEEMEDEDEETFRHDEDEEAFRHDEDGLDRSLSQAESALPSFIFPPDLPEPYDETTPLIQGTVSKGSCGSRMRRKGAASVSGHGDASVTDAVLMVYLKSLFLCSH
jgi:hypothetical protein